MKSTGIKFEFTAKTWRYNGPAGWVFVSLPEDMATLIRTNFKKEEEGWGRLKATAKIGISEWNTSIWFDMKIKTYLLPLKAAIRQKEHIEIGKYLTVTLWI
jgi:Domain of unknown function (DUF1905)